MPRIFDTNPLFSAQNFMMSLFQNLKRKGGSSYIPKKPIDFEF
ncbi:hypothetical protein LEP1GSC070_1564 [Leptospira santarosai str. AIM]|nr:hypothetical protein LEP1GSC070_1564 [Leptospira santarosai str. AIM]